jgi:ubiquinone/menaquinone biosynthesis C-methylase UbiE
MTRKDIRNKRKADLRRVRRKAAATPMPMMGGARIPEPKDPALDDLYLEGNEDERENKGEKGFRRLIGKYVSKGGMVDVACGRGHTAYMASQLTPQRVVGVDISPKAICMAKEQYQAPNLEFVVGDVYRLSERFGGFDLVTVTHSLHHFDDFERAMDNLVAVMSPKGTIYIQDFDRKRAAQMLAAVGSANSKMVEFFHILRNYPENQAAQMLRKKGAFNDRGILTYLSCLAGYTVDEVIAGLAQRGIAEIEYGFESDSPSYLLTAGSSLNGGVMRSKIRKVIGFLF